MWPHVRASRLLWSPLLPARVLHFGSPGHSWTKKWRQKRRHKSSPKVCANEAKMGTKLSAIWPPHDTPENIASNLVSTWCFRLADTVLWHRFRRQFRRHFGHHFWPHLRRHFWRHFGRHFWCYFWHHFGPGNASARCKGHVSHQKITCASTGIVGLSAVLCA